MIFGGAELSVEVLRVAVGVVELLLGVLWRARLLVVIRCFGRGWSQDLFLDRFRSGIFFLKTLFTPYFTALGDIFFPLAEVVLVIHTITSVRFSESPFLK